MTSSNTLELITREPVYTGDNFNQDGNYGPGYIGFSYSDSLISRGITHFTRWDRLSTIQVSHALIVISKTECIEALMHQGVVISPLSKYFDSTLYRIFFRKPRDLTSDLAQQITMAASSQLHQRFENKLILADMLRGSFIGHLIKALIIVYPNFFANGWTVTKAGFAVNWLLIV